MSVTIDDYVATARDSIRSESHGYAVGVCQLFVGKFGDRLPVSPDTYEVVELIETLWADPHIDQVPSAGSIELVWNAKGGGNEV
jgi:hypothetical protein